MKTKRGVRLKANPKRARKLPKLPTCRINGRICDECGIVHGKEAEELRCAVEKLIAGYNGRDDERLEAREVADDLQSLLDDVDARDALAYVNATVRKRGRRPPPGLRRYA